MSSLTEARYYLKYLRKGIKDWLAVDPESHFIHTKEGLGENFMFLPALFALGVEDLEDEEI